MSQKRMYILTIGVTLYLELAHLFAKVMREPFWILRKIMSLGDGSLESRAV